MRRLAKNSRNDSYLSNRDYQEIVRENTTTISFPLKEKHTLTLTKKIGLNQTAGFGGWFFPDSPCLLTVTVLSSFGTKVTSKTFSLSKDWNRVGLAWINEHSSDTMSIVLEFSDVEIVHTWGLTCDVFNVHELIIDAIEDQNKLIDVLNQEHLSPETYYLNHDSDTDLIENLESTEEIKIVNQSQKQISLKKCCYCQRYMPVNILVRSNSSFHKHKSKKTGFQNECRACKKWRINNSFNPVRTKDQLHESAVITREKKILLKEPEILQKIKNRNNGEGLKSIIWKKFDKKCFNCEKELTIEEVRLDHTRPLAYLWPIDEHATCLCEKCNNTKHDMFPIDFYQGDEDKLRRLARITGLDYESLVKRDVNEVELARIINNIEDFATNVEARTFRSIRNKVKEVRPDTDLFEILKSKNINLYNELQYELLTRKD